MSFPDSGMNLSLLFADGEVSSVASVGEAIHIRLSAAHVHRTDAATGGKPTEGYARGVLIVLTGARLHGSSSHFIGRVSHGRVHVGHRWLTAIALPSSIAGHLKVELTFGNQSQLAVAASGLECRFDGEANFAESLSC